MSGVLFSATKGVFLGDMIVGNARVQIWSISDLGATRSPAVVALTTPKLQPAAALRPINVGSPYVPKALSRAFSAFDKAPLFATQAAALAVTGVWPNAVPDVAFTVLPTALGTLASIADCVAGGIPSWSPP